MRLGWAILVLLAAVPDRDYSKGRAVLLPIKGDIELGLASFVERVTHDLKPEDTLVLEIDTFGGRVDAAVRIRDAILGTQARTVAFIHRRAISAGALISLGTDIIAMTSGGTIGAATPVQFGGLPSEGPKPVEEKIVSYMRKEMKATAEAKGRRSDIAEAMVDPDVEIEGINKKGKVLTLTTEEALKHGIAAYRVESLDELWTKLGVSKDRISHASVNWAERIARWLTAPVLSSLLMSIGFLALLMELYTGGHGIALVISMVCLSLFFFGHLVVKLAGWEELLLFGVGLGLLGVEIFLPGHIVPGLLGAACIVTSLVLALINLGPIPLDVGWSAGLIWAGVQQVAWAILLTVGFALIVAKFLPKTTMGQRLVLSAASSGSATVLPDAIAVDGVGSAATDLRPAGKVLIAGQRLDAISEGAFIEQGAPVRVIRTEGNHVVVRRV